MATPETRGYRAAAIFLRSIFGTVTRKDWHGAENLPTDSGFIAVSNHVSYADPITLAHYLYNNGHPPRFLAKSSLFEAPVLGRALYGLDQIPVFRGTARAKDSVDKGIEVLRRGDCIAMFPEGTLTRDPDLWPMVARPGAARMALDSGVPIIPVAQWGAHRLLAPYGKVPKPFPPKRITVVAGPPIDFTDLADQGRDAETLRTATDRITSTLTAMLADIRGEDAPAEPWDMRKGGRRSGGGA
ncbi:lysophospholipid acyltransferase family protein [Demequina capsici]|uniref:Lysophospholipid acyltransferase family protein n=1 Tax=Demequina capsici TaxID=3075620 RepID=A0AA96F8Z1_9MICO|nr:MULTISPECIES: lysophospholipid acyltransferase family protein [unclassified Demequina]WNM25373.1 lysophospholipid acyltransferase family protein [Demequina sp. OYTSA14]WNM28253.1 lysophospholipid acyltransferase family protein [Demequina sp. PMTSA13]